jgi:hypothetical protein
VDSGAAENLIQDAGWVGGQHLWVLLTHWICENALLRRSALISAAVMPARIELMHIIRKGQWWAAGHLRPAQQFYSLAA